jgi:hypothetical protein
MSGHNGTEEDVDGDWVDEDDAALGEGGGGLGQKTKEAAVSEDGGDQTQIPKEAIFIFFCLIISACACKKKEPGIMPSALRGRYLRGSLVRAQTC